MSALHIAFDRVYAHPLPEGHRFPMLKYELIPEQLLYEGVITSDNLFSPAEVDEETILLTHDKSYWDQLRTLTLPVPQQKRIGFPLTAELVQREKMIAQGTIDGCQFAFDNGVAFNVAGGTHHAGTNWGEGFCMLNDQAIAANYLLANDLARSILIIDLDVHQGNGTAQIFAGDPRVFTFSMHGANNFPMRKPKSDLDIALPDGTSDDDFLRLLKTALPKLIEQQNPDFIFFLAGVDVLTTDALGKIALSKHACQSRDRMVFETCIRHHTPVQVSMGGGYSPDIKDVVEAHCNTFKTALELYF